MRDILRAEARRLANPELSLAAERIDGGGTRIDFGLAQNFSNLILLCG